MQGIKFVFLAAFAVCALQCNAAEISRSADRLDIRLFVENGAIIARNMFGAVNKGLNDSKPSMDKILNELAPEARALARRMIDEARAKINEEEKQVTHIFTTLAKTLDTLKPVKSCYDKVAPDAKKLALAVEKRAATIVTKAEEKYKKQIQNIKTGVQKTLAKARTLFDAEVAAVIKCLVPGRKDASDCLNKELDKTLKESSDIISNILILVETAKESLAPMASEILTEMIPLLQDTIKNGKVVLKALGDCVAALK